MEQRDGDAPMLPCLRPDLVSLATYHPQAREAGADWLDGNEFPLDWPPSLKEKLAWMYRQDMENNRYPDGSHGELKYELCNYVGEGLTTGSLTADWLALGNGSDELIRSLLMATCLGQNAGILIAEPTFSMYQILARTLGIPVWAAGRDEQFAINTTQATELMNQEPIRVVFVVHPNSPTGNGLTPAERDWLKRLPPKVLVVIDEAYFEFSQDTLLPDLLAHPNWVILRTFSKGFRLANLRIGYAIAHPEVITALEKVRLPYNLSGFSLLAAQFALTQRRQLLSGIPEILTERERLGMELTKIPALQVWPSQGNFLYIRTTAVPLPQLHQSLRELGSLVRHTGGGLRLTIGSAAENSRLLQRLRQTCGG
ncbi:histidinol phosphate aminotransferase apoenzyme [Gloeomargarita lithophora Alchichica-D10]|uniref:Histidinol-phosphate aminotransferase n=2 Tax=Gloeomargarita TaxID=1188227 RepID=A0A1J0A8T8_9CYAN|nr:histidinol-phosphate transaminase [Gloeomargarita lithophora]APB32335.1 histidinol phosphate aminotransferase apoenzyme [Gloeomargarita lithophora Alchichica-D10]